MCVCVRVHARVRTHVCARVRVCVHACASKAHANKRGVSATPHYCVSWHPRGRQGVRAMHAKRLCRACVSAVQSHGSMPWLAFPGAKISLPANTLLLFLRFHCPNRDTGRCAAALLLVALPLSLARGWCVVRTKPGAAAVGCTPPWFSLLLPPSPVATQPRASSSVCVATDVFVATQTLTACPG